MTYFPLYRWLFFCSCRSLNVAFCIGLDTRHVTSQRSSSIRRLTIRRNVIGGGLVFRSLSLGILFTFTGTLGILVETGT